MTVDHAKLEEIFAAALAVGSPDERAAYVRRACGDDARLREEVDRLLWAHEQSVGFLEPPVMAFLPPAGDAPGDAPEAPGTMIGRYELRRLIGEGGFGCVYLAEQHQPVRRQVALKVIKLGMDTRQVIARFEAERQALAMMDHPNIARVLDAGATETGRPYFVMELVDGVPFTDFCDERRLTPRERLELFVPVCQAVQHAHTKGIIHRDLKPTNILVTTVDGRPVPKVIDFGVAKAVQHRLTERTLFTECRQFIGTPEYMAPEQAEPGGGNTGADVDTRCDVYSLGVLLYELLTGTTPFDAKALRAKAYGEVQRTIREVEPPRPSTRLATLGERLTTVAAQRRVEPRKLGSQVRGELDWVVMKCLEKDRRRRYETAAALAEDVRRFLASEPVVARPAGAAYRVQKFVRRHIVATVAITAVTTALVLGIVGTTVAMIHARAAQRVAESAGHDALAQRNAAQAAQRQAEQTAAEARREANRAAAAGDLVRGIFSLAQPESGAGGEEARAGDMLRKAAEQIDSRLRGQPLDQVFARATLAEAYQRLDLHDLAVAQLEAAYRQAADLPGGAQSERALGLACDLTTAIYLAGRPEQAEPLARATLEAARRTLGDMHPVTWDATNALALAVSTRGAADESFELWRGLVERLRSEPRARTIEYLGRYLANYSAGLRDRGRYDEASEAICEVARIIRSDRTRAVAAWDPLVATGGSGAVPPTALTGHRAGQPDAPFRTFPEAVRSNGWIARQLLESGRPAELVPLMEEYIAAALAVVPEGTPTLAGRMTDAGQMKLMAGDRAGAAAWYARAVEMGRRIRPRDVDQDVSRWREWTLGCSSFGLGWRSAALRDQVWCATDDLLRDNPSERLVPDEVDVERLRFDLRRWPAGSTDGGDARPVPVAAGSLAQLRDLPEPAPGLYLLGLEVPRLGAEPLRRAAWVLFAPWDVAVHPIPRFETIRTRFSPAWRDRLDPFVAPPIERSRPTALGINDILSMATGSVRRLHWFGVAATTPLDLPPGTYRVSASADDGVRVLVDGKEVVAFWNPHSSYTVDGEVALGSGRHELRVEYFQAVGAYNLWVQIAPRTPAARAAAAELGGGVPEWESFAAERLKDMSLRPEDALPVAYRAHALGRSGRFEESVAEFTKAVRLNPESFFEWYNLACMLAYRGNDRAWRDQARAMADRFGRSTDPRVLEQTAKACALLPDPPIDAARLTDLMDRATAGGAPAEFLHWFQLSRALCEYRAGRFQSAAGWARDALANQPAGPAAPPEPTFAPTAHLLIAMSERQLGRSDDAAAARRTAEDLIARQVGLPRVDDLEQGGLVNWLICQTLRREAEALFDRAAAPAAP